MAEDITVLQQYLTSTTTTSERPTPPRLYNTISTGPGGSPVVYLTLPKRRRGLKSAVDPGRAQKEIIEHVLGTVAKEVRSAYFAHLHPCFPVLDEKTFLDMWHDDNERISPTLICDLYASALQVWNRSAALRHQTRPDPHFIWNQAVSALQDDFMAPSISTVHAAVLDLLGRPVIGVTGNIVNAGRVVTLAQSLGLHRDPSSWKATDQEKSVRANLWWGVLIHDYWSSIGHGIPPTINPRYYDVPIPAFTTPAVSDCQTQAQSQESATFVQLCKLSQILGDILPLVYSLRDAPEDIKRRLRKIECALDDWVHELPEYLQPIRSTPTIVNGRSNLWFAYVSVKLLVCRLSFKTVFGELDRSLEARQYRLAMLREAASEVVDFATSLTEAQLEEFWMPYTSYLLITAATILLRCTIEASDPTTKRKCVTRLVEFRERLRLARDMSHWDLAEFCLERCDEPIQKIAEIIGLYPRDVPIDTTNFEPAMSTSTELDLTTIDTSAMHDLFLPIDPLDYPWETLWDSMEGPWSIQI
ncbi:hypothetical protein EKO04_007333 [Ascochyta lentis]|uniref:Xylanolytic transcriptional activator regulatory domain-containing protein n=1 Tax=Ascochyta lentis TaxID=205686 RepID=A0A8H7J0Z0_9PLEO|nr:hypothetical protein EKO04_007333 [Ascochyta lentis]